MRSWVLASMLLTGCVFDPGPPAVGDDDSDTDDGDEPIDLKNYKKENPDFPHESTADQMYSETQFESYRSLGLHQVNTICCKTDECTCKTLTDFEKNADRYLRMFQKSEEKNDKEFEKLKN